MGTMWWCGLVGAGDKMGGCRRSVCYPLCGLLISPQPQIQPHCTPPHVLPVLGLTRAATKHSRTSRINQHWENPNRTIGNQTGPENRPSSMVDQAVVAQTQVDSQHHDGRQQNHLYKRAAAVCTHLHDNLQQPAPRGRGVVPALLFTRSWVR